MVESAPRTATTAWLLDRVNPSVGPLVYLGLRDRLAAEGVALGWRDAVRAPELWRRLVIIPEALKAKTKDAAWLSLLGKASSNAFLASIDVSRCRNLTDKAMKAVAAGCASLTALDVSQCSNINDDAIKTVAVGCALLTALNVSHCRDLTNESMKAVGAGCASRTTLDVSQCSNITDEAMKAVAAGCASLTMFDVPHCSDLADEAIKAAATGCASLKTLDVWYCSILTVEAMKAVVACASLSSLALKRNGGKINIRTLPAAATPVFACFSF